MKSGINCSKQRSGRGDGRLRRCLSQHSPLNRPAASGEHLPVEYLTQFVRKDEEKAPGNIKGERKEERNQGQEERRVRKQSKDRRASPEQQGAGKSTKQEREDALVCMREKLFSDVMQTKQSEKIVIHEGGEDVRGAKEENSD